MEHLGVPSLRAFGGVALIGPAGPVDLGGPKQRAVLALLLLEPGTVVPMGRIVDRIWGGAPPAQVEASVRGYASNVRKALARAELGEEHSISFRAGGYVLDVPRTAIDLHVFEAFVTEGLEHAAANRLDEARRALSRALAQADGPPFGPTADELGLQDVATRIDARRADAVEALASVRLELGEHLELTAALPVEIDEQPYRERLHGLYALALYRSGRSVEALRSIDALRRALHEDIGIEPGPELRALEAAILANDASLDWHPPSAERATPDQAGSAEPRFGRAAEETLARSLVQRLPQVGGVLVVSGEPGIGKSALLRSVRDHARRRAVPVGWARCSESSTGAAYRPWQQATAALAADRAHGDRTPTEAHAAELARLRTLAGPAVVVIDDLQWADDATLNLVSSLAPHLEDLHILLAVGVRRTGPGELGPALRDCLAELARTVDPVHLTLSGLHAVDVAAWAEEVLGFESTEDLVGHLVATTAGNPFFLRELLELVRTDHLGQNGRDIAGDRIPHAVHDVVRRRTSQLPPSTQALLSLAAALGPSFDLDVLGAVADLDLTATLAELGPALDAGLVRPDPTTAARLDFSHGLVASTLAAEARPAARAALHARITDVLEELRSDDLDGWVDELSHHASEGILAGTARPALRYSKQAADRAEQAGSPVDAAIHLRRAIDAAGLVPDVSTRERRDLLFRLGVAQRSSGDPSARTTLVEAARLAEAQDDPTALAAILGELDIASLWAANDWNLHDPLVVAALERAVARGDLDRRDRVLLTTALAGELVYLDPARSNDLFVAAQELATGLDDAILQAHSLLRWFWSVSGPSGLEARHRIGDALIELDRAGRLPTPLRPLAHLARVSSALEVGDVDLARTCVTAARALADPVRTPAAWAHLQFAAAGLASLEGDPARVRAHARELRVALRWVRRYTADTSPASVLAVNAAESGRADEALRHLDLLRRSPYGGPLGWLEAWILAQAGRVAEAGPALAAFDGPLPDDWLFLPLTTAGVLAAAAIGDRRFLARHLPTLEPFAERMAFLGEGGFCLGPTSLALAEGHRTLGHADAARDHADRAVHDASRTGAVLWIPRADEALRSLG
ncbi:MAG: AAA family ATPase [Actinomycetota bacterium]|nr:AAA family ATPase [Actinomycetota bacterium]